MSKQVVILKPCAGIPLGSVLRDVKEYATLLSSGPVYRGLLDGSLVEVPVDCCSLLYDDPTGGVDISSWQPIETAPFEESVLLCGESGMVAPNDRFVTLGYREEGYRKGQWLDIKNELLSEHGWLPTHWLPMSALPSLPTIPRYSTKREEAAHYREALGAFLSPERFGYTVTPEVRDFVRVTLGMAPCETKRG